MSVRDECEVKSGVQITLVVGMLVVTHYAAVETWYEDR